MAGTDADSETTLLLPASSQTESEALLQDALPPHNARGSGASSVRVSCFPLGSTSPERSPLYNGTIEWAGFIQSVIWFSMAGFGPPWALFSIFGAICVTFYPDSTADLLNSNAYFYSEMIVPFIFAAVRLSIILHITFYREAVRRRGASNTAEADDYVSHREFWWTRRRFGLPFSCIFEFGDGMGRMWAIASVLDEFTLLYINNGVGLFTNKVYVVICLVIALISGLVRLLWWIWYWETFSARDPLASSIVSSRDDPELNYITKTGQADKRTKLKLTTRPPPAIASVYPNFSHNLPRWLRTSVKRVYSFMDGFGRTWAVFAVVDTIVHFKTTNDMRAFQYDAYFWAAMVCAVSGGLYVVFMGTYLRFKVFLH